MLLRQFSLVLTLTALAFSSSPTLAAPLLEEEINLWESSPQLLAQVQRKQRGQQGGEGRFMEKLSLSDAQKRQMQEIRQKYQPQITQKKTSLNAAQRELTSMMAGTTANATIRAKHQEITRLRQDLENLHFESILEMRSVLTAEQRSQLAQMMQQGWGKFRNRQGGGTSN